jgi:DNA topoisomerase-3
LINEFDLSTAGMLGQEGELIQRWVMNGKANYKERNYKRLWISSLTTRAIKRGFENLKPSANYDNLCTTLWIFPGAIWN